MKKDNEQFLNEKVQELKEQQESDLIIDFDAAIKEKKSQLKQYRVKFNEMPMSFGLFFFRHCYNKKSGKMNVDIPEEKMYEFIELMFGKKLVEEFSNSTVGMNLVFEKLSPQILKHWGYDTTDENVEKKT
jgi:hypothetical protein